MIENVVIYINDVPYTGWKRITLDWSLSQIFATLRFEAIEEPDINFSKWVPQYPVKMFANGELLFTGQIDKYDVNITSYGVSTSITARSSTAILADSMLPRGHVINAGLDVDTYVSNLTNLFDIEHVHIGNTSEIVLYDNQNILSPVDTELRNGLYTLRAAAISPTADGKLVIITDEKFPNNGTIDGIKKITNSIDETRRYNKYEATGGTEFGHGSIGAFSEVMDSTVHNDKRLIRKKVPGKSANSVVLDRYANWMKNTAYAYSRRVQVEVLGWRSTESSFFKPAQLIQLDGPLAKRALAAGEWLIETVTYHQVGTERVQFDEGGTYANLQLVKKEAYLNEPRDYTNDESFAFNEALIR